MDAMLGALSLGDIGHYFPPSDPQWKDADSLKLLAEVNQLIHEISHCKVEITVKVCS